MPRFTVREEAHRERAIEALSRLDLSKPWEISITRYRATRTLRQNSLYHMWVGQIAQETGHAHNEIHEWLRDEFLEPRSVSVAGKEKFYMPSTAALDTKEMTEYMERVEAWAGSELGMILPRPEDLGRGGFDGRG